jgi:hypothetical protein
MEVRDIVPWACCKAHPTSSGLPRLRALTRLPEEFLFCGCKCKSPNEAEVERYINMPTRSAFLATSAASFVLTRSLPAPMSTGPHSELTIGRRGPDTYHRLKEPAGMVFDADGDLRVANSLSFQREDGL